MLLEYFGDCGDFFSRIEEMSKDSLFLDFMANEEFDLTGRKSQIDCVRRIVTSEEISCGAVLVLKTFSEFDKAKTLGEELAVMMTSKALL